MLSSYVLLAKTMQSSCFITRIGHNLRIHNWISMENLLIMHESKTKTKNFVQNRAKIFTKRDDDTAAMSEHMQIHSWTWCPSVRDLELSKKAKERKSQWSQCNSHKELNSPPNYLNLAVSPVVSTRSPHAHYANQWTNVHKGALYTLCTRTIYTMYTPPPNLKYATSRSIKHK